MVCDQVAIHVVFGKFPAWQLIEYSKWWHELSIGEMNVYDLSLKYNSLYYSV